MLKLNNEETQPKASSPSTKKKNEYLSESIFFDIAGNLHELSHKKKIVDQITYYSLSYAHFFNNYQIHFILNENDVDMAVSVFKNLMSQEKNVLYSVFELLDDGKFFDILSQEKGIEKGDVFCEQMFQDDFDLDELPIILTAVNQPTLIRIRFLKFSLSQRSKNYTFIKIPTDYAPTSAVVTKLKNITMPRSNLTQIFSHEYRKFLPFPSPKSSVSLQQHDSIKKREKGEDILDRLSSPEIKRGKKKIIGELSSQIRFVTDELKSLINTSKEEKNRLNLKIKKLTNNLDEEDDPDVDSETQNAGKTDLVSRKRHLEMLDEKTEDLQAFQPRENIAVYEEMLHERDSELEFTKAKVKEITKHNVSLLKGRDSEISELKIKLVERARLITDLRNDIRSKRKRDSEVGKMKEEIKYAKRSLQHCQIEKTKSILEWKKRYQKASKKVKLLEGKLSNLDSDTSKLRNEHQKMARYKDEEIRKLSKVNSSLAQVSKSIDSTASDNVKLREKIRDLSKASEEMRKKMKRKIKSIEMIRESEKKASSKEIDKLKKESLSTKMNYTKKLAIYKEEISKIIQNRKIELENITKKYLSQIKDLKRANQRLKSRHGEEIRRIKKEAEKSQQKYQFIISEMSDQLNGNDNQTEERLKMFEHVKQNNEELREENLKYQEDIAKLSVIEKENSALQQKNREFNNKLSQLQEGFSKKKDQDVDNIKQKFEKEIEFLKENYRKILRTQKERMEKTLAIEIEKIGEDNKSQLEENEDVIRKRNVIILDLQGKLDERDELIKEYEKASLSMDKDSPKVMQLEAALAKKNTAYLKARTHAKKLSYSMKIVKEQLKKNQLLLKDLLNKFETSEQKKVQVMNDLRERELTVESMRNRLEEQKERIAESNAANMILVKLRGLGSESEMLQFLKDNFL